MNKTKLISMLNKMKKDEALASNYNAYVDKTFVKIINAISSFEEDEEEEDDMK